MRLVSALGLPLRFGKTVAERRALGQEVDAPPRPRRQMRDVSPKERRATVFCRKHNKRVAVLTDREVITRNANAPYSRASPVTATCTGCLREDNVSLYLDMGKLREVWRDRARNKVDVSVVVPDWLLEEYPALRS